MARKDGHEMDIGELKSSISFIRESLTEGRNRFTGMDVSLDKQRRDFELKLGDVSVRVRKLEEYQWRRLGARTVLSAVISAAVSFVTVYLMFVSNFMR